MNSSVSRGFTLVEMVIAFAILSLSLTVLYSAFGNALRRTAHDARLSEATLIVESLVARAGTEISLTGNPATGQWNEFSYEITHKAASETVDISPNLAQVVEVTAVVAWTESAGTRSIALSTVKLLPGKTT